MEDPFVRIFRYEIIEETVIQKSFGRFKDFIINLLNIQVKVVKDYRLRILFSEMNINRKVPKGVNIYLGNSSLWRVMLSQDDYIEVINIAHVEDILVLGNGLLIGYTHYKEK